MIEVTNLALEVLDEALKASEVQAEEGFCIRRRNGVPVLDLKKPEPNDKVVSRNGRVIYMIDPKNEAEIGRGCIDVCDTNEGLQLVFRKAGLMSNKEKVDRINDPLLEQGEIRDSQDCYSCGLNLGKGN